MQDTPDFVLQIQGKDIEKVSTFNYLVVMLDEHLHWKEHVDTICNKVSKRLGLLARVRSTSAKCVYNTLIEQILSYTDTAWGELSVASSKSFQRLQNRAACIIQKRDSFRDSFNALGWVDLETNRKIHKCMLVFQCLHGLVPQYLCDYFIRNCNVHYNTRRKTDIHLPKPKLSLGKRSFRFSGSILFNSLPTKIQRAE